MEFNLEFAKDKSEDLFGIFVEIPTLVKQFLNVDL